MLKFLKDCQLFLRFCGYCTHDPIETSPRYRWSGLTNHLLTFLFVYFVGTSIIFVSDDRQSRDDRILQALCVVAYLQQALAHLTFTANKLKICNFLNHFELVANRSKFVTFQTSFRFKSGHPQSLS